jgi:predicted nucleic acid-binding protein
VPLLVDTGVVYALADRSDAWHASVVALLKAAREPLLAPVTILPEVTYLLATRLGLHAERAFARSLAGGELSVEPLKAADVARASILLGLYPDIGFVDATVVAMAERLKVKELATTDRRHFAQVQPAHVGSLTLLPVRR